LPDFSTSENQKYNGSMKLNTSTDQDGRDGLGLREVLVDLPDSLMAAAQIEAKRVGQSLEQWVAHTVTAALEKELNGEHARG
jgi:hypothetical protein